MHSVGNYAATFSVGKYYSESCFSAAIRDISTLGFNDLEFLNGDGIQACR
jgi:hypothetical protein